MPTTLADIEPVTLHEIAERLHYSRATVSMWAHRRRFCCAFPQHLWWKSPRQERLYDWVLVELWYHHTHPGVRLPRV